MSDNKKYYYLKLKEDFFDSDEIVILESMPDGYIYSNILLKLYVRSLKNEGRLMFNDRIPFNSAMLAKVTRHSVGDIEKSIQIFRDLNLIEVLDNGAIYISDIQNFIGTSSSEADRKRDYRRRIDDEKKQLSHSKITQGQMSNECEDICPDKNPPEIEIEKEIEKDIKKEIQLQQGVWLSVITFQKLWLFPNEIQKEDLTELINQYGDGLVDAAIKVAGSKDVAKKNAINFITACLKEWTDAGVRTIEDAREYTKQRAGRKKQFYGSQSYNPPIRKEELSECVRTPFVENEDPEMMEKVQQALEQYMIEKSEVQND